MTTALPNTTPFPNQLKHLQENMGSLSTAAPATMQAFGALHKAATSDGVLDAKVKELIALSIAVSARCDGCIAYHTHDAMKAGASKQEITEALEVAILMGGGPALVYATHVFDAIEQFERDVTS